eukprot:scaffold333_cov133-Cylindrotheca_fusiformis.AAC.40
MVAINQVEKVVLSCIEKGGGETVLRDVGNVCKAAFGSKVENKLGYSKLVKLIEALDSARAIIIVLESTASTPIEVSFSSTAVGS